jgi:DNA gyrase/topoisomerase IV subunit A
MMQWFVWLKVEYALPLVDGQGNFGSVDGDSQQQLPRMRRISEEIMADIEKETVDFQLNLMILL